MLSEVLRLWVTLDMVHEITKLIEKSPKQKAVFQKIKDDVTRGHQESVFYVQLTGLFELKHCHQFQRITKLSSLLGMKQ